MDYIELSVRIGPAGPDGSLAVHVSSQEGEGDATMTPPFALSDLLGVVHGLHPYVAPDPNADPSVPVAPPKPVPPKAYSEAQDYGVQLYRALFQGETATIMDRTLDAARGGTGVRVRLRMDPRDPGVCAAAALPWELMRPTRDDDPLAISRRTPVVRSIDTPQRQNPDPIDGPLRILALKSNPPGTAQLNLDQEADDIEAHWKGMENVQYDVVAPNKQAIQRALNGADYHVIHYMGHGGFDPASTGGRLLLENPDGTLYPESADVFASWLGGSPVRLVFLNACQTGRTPERSEVPPFGGVAASLIRHGVPAVVGNQFSVADNSAITFSSTFYERIAQGHPVDEAVASARNALFDDQTMPVEWATPVLYMRSTDGDLFGRRTVPAATQPTPAAAPSAPPPQPEPVRAMSEPPSRAINISGSNTGGVFITGDNSHADTTTTVTMGALPAPESVDMNAVMAQLRALVDQIADAKQKSIATNALNTADLEVQDPAHPDKPAAATALTQAVQIIKSNDSLGTKAAELTPLVMKAAAWLTPNVAIPLLKLLAPV